MKFKNEIEQLRGYQKALKKKGAKDVKFFFGKTSEKPKSQVMLAAAEVLRYILEGKHTAMRSFGDALKAKQTR